MIDWSEYWYMSDDGVMRCVRCDAEVWFIDNGYICSGKAMCFNEDVEW